MPTLSHPNVYWILLIIAGLLETGWAIGLKYADGFTRFWPSVWTTAALVASMILLSLAARGIPIGTAYAVWVGIGAAGTVLLEVLLLQQKLGGAKLFFIGLLLVAIAGLKWSSGDAKTQPPGEEQAALESD